MVRIFLNLVKKFISFPTSTKITKTEFGVKSYDQNMKTSNVVRPDGTSGTIGVLAFIECSKID
jgi:hypothetical protein